MPMDSRSSILIRRLECTAGYVSVRVLYEPRPGVPGRTEPPPFKLAVEPDLHLVPGVATKTELQSGHAIDTVLAAPQSEIHPSQVLEALEGTERWWRRWSDGIRSGEPYREVLVRSLINLRLLTHTPSGAPVAAPTTSLPEEIGGVRNWDYRYSWPRDASVGVAAFLAVGKSEEACGFVDWLVKCAARDEEPIRVLYSLDGERSGPERKVSGVSGYRGSLPVRIGNLAEKQHQLDVYGWVIDALWNLVAAGEGLNRAGRRAVSDYADFVAANWRRPDAGLWEVRDQPAQYVHSKIWAWIALDRAVRLGSLLRLSRRRVVVWERERDVLAADVRQHGFNEELGSYVRAYGSEEMDSALLLLPLTGFDPAGSGRLAGTVDAIWRRLGAGGPLLYRYPLGRDGLPGTEGAFLPCSFWLLEALLRLGRNEEGIRLLEDLLALANELLLLPEEVDPKTGSYLGNYPLALSQAGLVHAVLELQKVLRD